MKTVKQIWSMTRRLSINDLLLLCERLWSKKNTKKLTTPQTSAAAPTTDYSNLELISNIYTCSYFVQPIALLKKTFLFQMIIWESVPSAEAARRQQRRNGARGEKGSAVDRNGCLKTALITKRGKNWHTNINTSSGAFRNQPSLSPHDSIDAAHQGHILCVVLDPVMVLQIPLK